MQLDRQFWEALDYCPTQGRAVLVTVNTTVGKFHVASASRSMFLEVETRDYSWQQQQKYRVLVLGIQ